MLRGLLSRTRPWARQLWAATPQSVSTSRAAAIDVLPVVRWSVLPLGLAAAALSTPLYAEPEAPPNPEEVLRHISALLTASRLQAQPAAAKQEGEEEDWTGPVDQEGNPSQNIEDYDDPFECPCTLRIPPSPS